MSDYVHTMTVHGSKSGLGIRVVGPSTPDTHYGVFVKSVTEGSLADTDGQLRTGDKLVQVGEVVLTGKTQRQAIDVLKLEAQTDTMVFIVDRSQEAADEFNLLMTHTGSEMKSTSTSSIIGPSLSSTGGDELEEREEHEKSTEESVSVSQTPTTSKITIKKKTQLGISVAGGEGNPEGPHVSIKDITEGGDAHLDDRLKIGDVLLSINGISFQSIELTKVLQLLTRMKISRRTNHYTIEFQRYGFSPALEGQTQENVSSEVVKKTSDSEEHISEGLGTNRSSRLRNSDSKQKHGRKKGIQRKISLDPHCKVKLSKLERALNYLGYTPSEEQRTELHNNLDIDEDGYVTYLDFVNEAKRLFAIQIDERQLSSGLFLLGSKPRDDRDDTQKEMDLEPEVFELAGDEDTHNIPDLLEEIAVLNKRLEVAEVQNVSNKVLRSENEKTIRRLVAELQQQRNQTPAPKHDPDGEDLNRKIATMDCEYRKLECNVKRYEVACEKLLQFCQLAHENLSEAQGTELFVNYPRGTGESARGGNDVLGNPRPPAALANHTKFTNITLAQEAQETVAAVRKIISQASVLPRGWDEAYTEDGLKYYINYETQTTTWLHPVTKTGHTKFSRHGEMTAPFTQPPNL